MSYFFKVTIGVGAVAIFMLGLVVGCSKVRQHRVLTFFFDGVPPLGREYLDPNSPEYLRLVEAGAVASRSSEHEPNKKCSNCHGDGTERVFGASGMDIEIPGLCFKCHEDTRQLQPYVHGPVAVGECLLCHDPHRSSHEKLLKKPVPVLCLECHDARDIAQIENHSDKLNAACNRCHEGHMSPTKHLLISGKEDDFKVRTKPDENAEPMEE